MPKSTAISCGMTWLRTISLINLRSTFHLQINLYNSVEHILISRFSTLEAMDIGFQAEDMKTSVANLAGEVFG